MDDALQGLSSDPYNAPLASGPGLRVPSFQPNGSGIYDRYLFLLATRQVNRRTIISGLSQLVTIGTNASSSLDGGIQMRPIEFPVTTPTFRFPDGNISCIW